MPPAHEHLNFVTIPATLARNLCSDSRTVQAQARQLLSSRLAAAKATPELISNTCVLGILDAWREHLLAVDQKMLALEELAGGSPESPLPSAVRALQGELTRQVAARLGWCEETLTDWWLTHNFGEQPMRMGLKGAPLRVIASNLELAAFIAEDLLCH
jgi:hypothetical protein